MPELPEVETVKNYLEPLLKNQKFTEIKVLNSNLRIPVPTDLPEKLINVVIQKVSRRAKYITIYLENDLVLIMHLGMTGKILTFLEQPKLNKHDHLIFKIAKGNYFTFNDTRKFGLVTYLPDKNLHSSKLFGHLGIEPLAEEFTGAYLQKILQNSQSEIKKFIMEQKNIVGVGNIYASEALFMSKIHPQRKANKLTITACHELVRNIKDVLRQAIKKGGSTIKDYKSVSGESGYIQHEFKTYGRENNPCKICNTAIKKIVQGGRSTFYCPVCQKN